jgi:hypothetical protein
MSASPDLQLIESFRARFITFLTSPKPPDRRPLPKWKVHLRQDLTTEDSTGRVFFDNGGAQAWVAFEALRPTSTHRSGQQDQHRLFAKLNEQPLESKARLAKMVGAASPHPTLGGLISSVDQFGRSFYGSDTLWSVQNASTPAKRRRRFPSQMLGASCWLTTQALRNGLQDPA